MVKKYFPDNWKISIIKLLFKKGSRRDSNNYRPISITPCIARLFKRLILLRLNAFIKDKNLIREEQSGFRSQRQTRDNFFTIIQKSKEAMNRGHKAILITFDMASAFDKVWHDGIIYRLSEMGVPLYLINIIASFLNNRHFKVKIGNFTTNKYKSTRGAPQGACLSPEIYKDYSNTMPIKRKKNVAYSVTFADDLAYLRIFNKWDSKVNDEINAYLRELELWAKEWRMTFAPQKTKVTIFSAKTDKVLISSVNLKLNGITITHEKNPKFLGVVLDSNMNFESHVESVRQKATNRLSILKILGHSTWKLNKDTLKKVYYSLILSLMDYVAPIFNCFDIKAMKEFQTIQNLSLRSIHKKWYEHKTGRQLNTLELHKLANERPIKERMDFLAKKYFVDAINNKNPLVLTIMHEYKAFKGGRQLTHATPLDAFEIYDYLLPIRNSKGQYGPDI